MIRILFLLLTSSFVARPAFSQQATDESQIHTVLWDYINGRNEGNLEQLKRAFHINSDLRYVRNDTLRIWASQDYIDGIKPGRKQNCIVRIVWLDIDGDAAQAKIEMEYPTVKFADYINLLKLNGRWQIAVKSFSRTVMNTQRVLFVLTSHEQMGNTGKKTGFHFGEVSHAYKPIHDAGYEIDFVSPEGGNTSFYGANMNDSLSLWMIQNPTAYYKLTHAMTPYEIDASKYAAIYYVGGHGTMWDLPENDAIAGITKTIYENDGIVSAICHGPSGLVNIKLSNGRYLVDGKNLTSFTNDEERASKQDQVVPFMLETELMKKGAEFIGGENWAKNVVVDGRLITGQNPASAYGVAKEILQLLEQK
ncbi:MAG: nuclear transport factor 2 family protein [Bacteroidota bacterium]